MRNRRPSLPGAAALSGEGRKVESQQCTTWLPRSYGQFMHLKVKDFRNMKYETSILNDFPLFWEQAIIFILMPIILMGAYRYIKRSTGTFTKKRYKRGTVWKIVIKKGTKM
jgi:hypothetical protein